MLNAVIVSCCRRAILKCAATKVFDAERREDCPVQRSHSHLIVVTLLRADKKSFSGSGGAGGGVLQGRREQPCRRLAPNIERRSPGQLEGGPL